jgi:4-amino-4-deoxy-L-arabinose transferase-like glycosyltransferase
LQPSALAKRLVVLLFLITVAFYFYGLGHLPLVGPDEPRYAQVAREMFLRGDLITPTLAGHTWFEKPALLYWMMIAAYKVFGVNEFAVRIGAAACGLLTILAVWVLTRKFECRQSDELKGLSSWSALAMATSLGLIVFSRGATFDVVVTMPITWAFVCFLSQESAIKKKNRQLLLLAFYAAIGVALLAKGLVGLVIPAGVIALYYIVARKKPSRETFISLLWGLPVVLLVSALWYGPVIARHGWSFINEFFVQHHFARYVSDKYQHRQRFYFYIPILLMLALPWSAIFIDSIAHLRLSKQREKNPDEQLTLFALSWIVFPLLFFSLSGSKLPGYILPVLPAVAILTGDRMRRLASNQHANWSLIATGAIAIALAAGGVYYAKRSGAFSTPRALIVTLPLWIAGLMTFVLRRKTATALLTVALGTVFSVVASLRLAAVQVAQRQSVRDLIVAADRRGLANAPIFIRRGSDRTAEFYASDRVVYGSNGEPQPLEELPEIVAEAKRRGQIILVLIPVEYLENYKRSPEVEILADNGNLALIATKSESR